jgi:hypothetical protein
VRPSLIVSTPTAECSAVGVLAFRPHHPVCKIGSQTTLNGLWNDPRPYFRARIVLGYLRPAARLLLRRAWTWAARAACSEERQECVSSTRSAPRAVGWDSARGLRRHRRNPPPDHDTQGDWANAFAQSCPTLLARTAPEPKPEPPAHCPPSDFWPYPVALRSMFSQALCKAPDRDFEGDRRCSEHNPRPSAFQSAKPPLAHVFLRTGFVHGGKTLILALPKALNRRFLRSFVHDQLMKRVAEGRAGTLQRMRSRF